VDITPNDTKVFVALEGDSIAVVKVPTDKVNPRGIARH